MRKNHEKQKINSHKNEWEIVEKLCKKNDQNHPSLNLYCFHIVSVAEFIETLNKTEDLELLILHFMFLLSFTIFEILRFYFYAIFVSLQSL